MKNEPSLLQSTLSPVQPWKEKTVGGLSNGHQQSHLHTCWHTTRPVSDVTEKSEETQRGRLVLTAVVVAGRARHFLCPPQKPPKTAPSQRRKKMDRRCIVVAVGRHNIRHRKCHERNGLSFSFVTSEQLTKSFHCAAHGDCHALRAAAVRVDAAAPGGVRRGNGGLVTFGENSSSQKNTSRFATTCL